MNTFEPFPARKRVASPVSFRTRGCVLLEESGGEEDLAAKEEAAALKNAAALKEKQDREAIRRAAEESTEKRMALQIEAMRQAQQQLWKNLNLELGVTLKGLAEDIKRQLIEMSIRTAEIILCHKLPDVDMVRSVLVEVLSPISDLQGVRVKVAPGSMEALTGGGSAPRSHPGIECVEDPELKPGDVVVESRNGIFDGRLRSRLDQLAEALAQPPVDETAEK